MYAGQTRSPPVARFGARHAGNYQDTKENYPNLITMKTILLKTYLQEMIIYIHAKNEIKERKKHIIQRSRGALHALIRPHFLLLKLTNHVPLLCLLPRFAAELRPAIFDRFDHHPEKTLPARLRQFSSKFQKSILYEGALRQRNTRELYSNNLRAVGSKHPS